MPDPTSSSSALQLVPPPAKASAPATAAGLEEVLNSFGAEFRFNTRSSKVEERHGGGDWKPLAERPAARLRERIAEEFDEEREQQQTKPRPLRFTDSRWRHAVNALVADREVDPFIEALEALRPWDRVRRGSTTGSEQCFVLDPGTPPALRAWAARSVLLAAVWRAYKPGTKHDVIVVLVGPQGVGKS